MEGEADRWYLQPPKQLHELICGLHPAIVEQVRDGSTVRVRLLLPEGDHQFVNVAMAGVRTPRASSKQGEPSEQWGEQVTRIYAVVSFCGALTHDILAAGQVLYRVEATSTTRSGDASLHTAIDRHSIPGRFIKCSSPSDDLYWQRYVLCLRREKNSFSHPIHCSHPPCRKHC